MTEYGRQLLQQENDLVRTMLVYYGIREVTTDKQAKNGTREFEFPVPCYSKQRLKWFKSKKYDLKDLPRLRIASFKSGYVRKQNGACRAYQINPVYMQNYQCVWQRDNGELYTSNGVNHSRALIHSPIVRLNYILKFYLKNYANN
ncbi:MAG: hypothetical protein GY787_28470 [Alteromonadales bacterium]|nr:hypothetical protein [Alteromonadales bacterium]